MVMLFASALVKLAASTVTEYTPGDSASKRYTPSAFALVERSKALAPSRAVTVALVTTAPVGSFTVTCNSLFAAFCADEIPAATNNKLAKLKYFSNRVIAVSPSRRMRVPRYGGARPRRGSTDASARFVHHQACVEQALILVGNRTG